MGVGVVGMCWVSLVATGQHTVCPWTKGFFASPTRLVARHLAAADTMSNHSARLAGVESMSGVLGRW